MDMKELLSKLDSIGSEIAEENVNENTTESNIEEAVAEFADPIYDLIAELGNDDKAHKNVLHDLIRYLDDKQIKDFVDEFRRVNDYGNGGMEYESVDEREDTVKEAMVSLDKGREYFFDKHDFGDENIAYEFNKLAKKMSPEDAETLKKELLDLYGDDVGLDEDTVSEADVQETVEVAVNDLRSLLDLAGLNPQKTTQATTELGEYANSPDEDYQDTDVQLNKMSGGLNGPKGQHKKEYPGDNPLAAELSEKLKAMLEK